LLPATIQIGPDAGYAIILTPNEAD
jgi:hypothetical protein